MLSGTRTPLFIILASAHAFACSSENTGNPSSSPDAGTGTDALAEAADCDPRPGSGTGGSDSGTSSGDSGFVSGDLEGGLEGGEPPPGHFLCFDEASRVGFVCENFNLLCCEKKSLCYDPVTESTFCDRPYCD